MKLIKYITFLFILLLSSLWMLDYNFKKKQFDFYKIKKILTKETIYLLKKKSTEFIDYDFTITQTENYFLENKKVKLDKFSNKILKFRYYLNQSKDNVFLITNDGSMFFFQKKNLFNKQKITLKNITTNLDKIIGTKYIEDKMIIVKGILIINQKVYISYINNNNGCYSNAIAEGILSTEKIHFSSFFKIDECKDYWGLAMGGNIQNFKNNKIIMTTGDYDSYEMTKRFRYLLKYRNDPQNKNSYYGKILSIDLTTKNINILSMGHRNSQGLFYDFNEDIIFSTDHGPQGGDELNIDVSPNKNTIKNFGWAISSYGEHYGRDDGHSVSIDNYELPDVGLESNIDKAAPLKKSHKKYGFEEPIKYFTPSIGITQVLKVNNSTNNDYKLLVGSMGSKKEEGDMTVHILHFNKDFKETKYEKIYIGERIRDMIDLNNGHVLMSLESTGSLGLLKNIY